MRFLLLLALAVTAFAADKKPLPWEKNRLLSGQALYRANCAVCHDVDKSAADSKKMGPSLNHLFQQEKLPLSGDKVSRAAVKDKIQQGGFIMPAFPSSMLNDSEITTLLDYLQTK